MELAQRKGFLVFLKFSYEDRIFYNKRALNNLKYPKKRKYDILVFVGDNMKNKTN